MGRGRGKGKKLTTVSSHEDPGSGGEDSIPAYKRRGRPQKPLKDEIEEDEVEKVEDEEPETLGKSKETKVPSVTESGKKRKKFPQIKDNGDPNTEENGDARSGKDDVVKPNGFRLNGSRRKSKPRRAAEAVVECN
ncbi:uncharacterized protein LOC116256219 [Nymphaea colorata]|uniref:Uncharacterized protein n=1 Tax=Nymphaea colorata TaxID=210225 RepID=A0A5K1EHC2_9MAGN|nr:uncharacterized protein LOC116256219 [Nymphaea colorata]